MILIIYISFCVLLLLQVVAGFACLSVRSDGVVFLQFSLLAVYFCDFVMISRSSVSNKLSNRSLRAFH